MEALGEERRQECLVERDSQGGGLIVGLGVVNFMILVTFLYLGLTIWKIGIFFFNFCNDFNLCKKLYDGNYEVLAKIMTDVLLVFNAIHVNPVLCKVL